MKVEWTPRFVDRFSGTSVKNVAVREIAQWGPAEDWSDWDSDTAR